MEDLLFFAFLAILAFITLTIVKKIQGNKTLGKQDKLEEKFPYKKKDYLLTVSERNFYDVLSQAAQNNNFLLFTKVRLEDLFWLPKYTKNIFSLRNRIKSRHVDFLLCDKANIKPLLAIELDDSSHYQEDRIERDNFVDKIMHDAELPILHIETQNFYDLKELENKINNFLIK